MEKLMILDGNSIVNRAFYAIRLLTNNEGLYTNAIYGFLNILFRYLDEEKPDGLCVAFDLHAPTFRHKQYDLYKAQRKGMPDELRQQMPVLKDVLSAMNIPILEKEGFEADDIIGTVSKMCEENSTECIILTGDKDDLQLASQKTKIKLVITRMGKTDTTDFHDTDVFEKYGVTPKEFIDVKGLMGDTSDNIPGVSGIGEKTAFDLISKFKSIDNIYENIDVIDIKPGVRTKLKDGKDMAYLSRSLSEIVRDVPIDGNISDWDIKEYDNVRLKELFLKLNFTSFIKRLDLAKENDMKPEIKLSDFSKIKSNEKIFYYTDGKAAAISDGENTAETSYENIIPILEDEKTEKIGFDLKADMVRLGSTGREFKNPAFDVMLAAYICDPSKSNYDIDKLGEEYASFFGDGSVCDRLAALMLLYNIFGEKIKERGQEKLFFEIEMPLTEVLAQMQLKGVAIDKKSLKAFGEKLSGRIEILTSRIYGRAGMEFNINSPKQLGEVLFEKMRLPVIKKTKSGYSTNAEVLEKLKDSDEIIGYILEYRSLTKLKSTYVEGLLAVINPKTGRIHSSFNQTVTVTGRISSTEPNMQNIPVRTELGREMRKMFYADGENRIFVDADYSQIELRVLAHIADDKNMIEAFISGADIHTITASQVFGVPVNEVTSSMRSSAKAVNFGIVYGISDFSLSQDLKITRKEAKEYKDSYLANFSGVRDYMENIIEQAKKDGYVTTALNRRRDLPELSAGNFITRSFGERVALNTPIQGTAADIIKIAMVRVYNRLKKEVPSADLVLQVHDELIIEADESDEVKVREILKTEMENAVKLKVPLVADVNSGKSWYDVK